MHRRVRCPHCHHWTDALLVWAAGDSCPNCNTPMSVSADQPPPTVQPGRAQRRPWHSAERSWRSPGGAGPAGTLSRQL